MKFNYQARTKTGEVQMGVIEASSREAAISLLRRHDLYVTLLEEEVKRPVIAREIKFLKKTTMKDLVLFTRQLSIMFRSKIPLVETLRTMYSQTQNPNLREKIQKISEEVQGGTLLSAAFSHYPKIFSPFYVSMVKSGELSGKLSGCLDYLADYLESQYRLTQNIKGALIYPMLVLAMAILMLFFASFFILPQLKAALMESGAELPTITKLVINFGDFIKKWGWALILILVGLISLLIQYRKTKEGKKVTDNILIKIPLIGSLSKMIYLARLAEDLSTLVSGGLPIADALGTSANTIGNNSYKEAILKTREDVRRGESISYSFSYFPELFPPMFTQMVIVGEKTGRIDVVLKEVSQFYQKEIDRDIQNLISLLEPAMIIFLGLGIGGIAVSVIMPLYKMMGGF
ncbi:hypothetical protein AMJ49_02500 [Parcubacteria bacterium DG_74_2]|nr:MAG: hypothetical protein AMJ49_02500 [Parcubacteria bacterium DG_74_2]